MATPQSSFIIEQLPTFGGTFIDSQYLGHSYETGKPHVFQNALTTVFSAQTDLFNGKLLTNMTDGKLGGTMEIDTEVYRWSLQGAEEKFARVLENLESTNAAPGLGLTPFKIKLDLNYYASPDVLFGEDNEYPLAIVEGPIPDGTGYIYIVKLQTDNPSLWVPQSMLQPGKEFNKVWTSVQSEYNGEHGGQQYPNSFKLESQVGAFAQKFTVTDKAWREDGRLSVQFNYIVDGKTKRATRFLPMAEAKMWDTLYKSIEAAMVYGKRSTQPGPDGYWKKTGPGMRQQLKDGWIQYFNGPLSISNLKDYLLDIFVTRKNENERRTVAMTGTLGAQLFHDALVAMSNGYLTVDTNWINRISSPVETPHLAFGAQFTRYNGPHGVTIDLMHNPMYDSREYCKRMHPEYPNLPIDSARFTFLNLGRTNGEANIKMLKVKDTFRWGYVAGTHTPTGPVKGGQAGSLKAGYDMFCEGTGGLWINDVTQCGEYIYDFEF